MSFIKKNLIFFIVVLISVAAFATGAYLAFAKLGNMKKSERSLSNVEAQLSSLYSKKPSLTEGNVEAAEQNVAELKAALADIREDLQQGAALEMSEDGVSVIAGIQQYISRFQRSVDKRSDESGELPPIKTPDNFAFGFDRYLNNAPIPDDSGKVATLDKQQQILSYLLTQLIAADPESIDKVQREVLEDTSNAKTFAINDAISARVPGAIDTMAFSLTFTGYTYALRDFLNSLAQFELPIVVRDIKVKRPSGSQTVAAPAAAGGAGFAFDLFEQGTSSGAAPESSSDDREVVIEDNISQFTIILEFIEVVLPDTQNKEAS